MDRVQRWNMAAVCGGRVMFVVVLCTTLIGLAICATTPPSVQQQLDEINEKLKYGKIYTHRRLFIYNSTLRRDGARCVATGGGGRAVCPGWNFWCGVVEHRQGRWASDLEVSGSIAGRPAVNASTLDKLFTNTRRFLCSSSQGR